MNKVALFDFCETLANFQTADPFVDYVRDHRQQKRMVRWEKIKRLHDRSIIIGLIEYIFFPKFSISKRLKLFQLRGFCKSDLEIFAKGYYKEKIKPNLIKKVLEEMTSLKSEGYKIYLVSGGYDIYLKYFVQDYELDGCISSKIGFKGNICTGHLDGKDCMFDNKVTLLDRFFVTKPSFTVAYSDSKTDIPFLKWADEGVVISKNRPKEWAGDNNFREIIW